MWYVRVYEATADPFALFEIDVPKQVKQQVKPPSIDVRLLREMECRFLRERLSRLIANNFEITWTNR